MKLNGHVKQAILFGLSKETKKLADDVKIKLTLENSTGIFFSAYFENRKSAHTLEAHLHDWVAENFVKIRNQYDEKAMPFHESNLIERTMGGTGIQSFLAKSVHSNILSDVFGAERYINALNKLYPLGLQAEFYAEGDKISDRDYSFLLEEN